MFIDIYDNGNGFWEIEDTDFVSNSGYPCPYHPAIEAIVAVYEYKDLNPLSSIKIYYNRFGAKYRIRHLHNEMARMVFKEYFIARYYQCIKNHISKLEWIGK